MFSKVDGRWGITSFGLKVIGILLMVVDHIHEMFYYVGIPTAFTMIGRVVAPIFLFLAAEGYYYTHSKFRYLRNLLVGFWITSMMELVLQLYLPNPHIVLINSIFGTLFLSLSLMWIVDGLSHPKQNTKMFMFALGALLILIVASLGIFALMSLNDMTLLRTYMIFVPSFLTVEGGLPFMLLGVLFHWTRGNTKIQALVMLLFGLSTLLYVHDGITWMMIFATPFIYFYNGEQGKKSKWFFYLFYPTHIAILYIVATLLFPK